MLNSLFRVRFALWRRIRAGIPEGSLLPGWAIVIRALLFPLDFFYWRMSGARGYQIKDDTWLIGGVRYSECFMRHLAEADGEVFRVTRSGSNVVLERVD